MKSVRDYLIVTALAFLMAVNYEVFILQNAFAPAGINGIATMIQYKFNFSVGYMNLLINIPLCIWAFFWLNKDYAGKTIVFSLAFSAFLLVFKYRIIDISRFVYVTENGTSTLLAPLAASVVNGFIYGTIVRLNGSTGGTDVIAACVRKKNPRLSLMWIIFAMNCLVAAVSYFVYDYQLEPVILCIGYSFVTSKISDGIIKGVKQAVKFEIVTDNYEKLANEIMTKLHHGVTVMQATGMYTRSEHDVMICVVNKHQIIDLQKILLNYPGSFAYISDVRETMGNFKKITK
ncbi:MAG: YitT family protein [Clostridia bacterium]|nr:YitT family protein [Clostridia bacterium]